METLEELVGQREQLLRAGATVKETDDQVSKAKRILISMGKRYNDILLLHATAVWLPVLAVVRFNYCVFVAIEWLQTN